MPFASKKPAGGRGGFAQLPGVLEATARPPAVGPVWPNSTAGGVGGGADAASGAIDA
jgi:hypothetical protein